MGWFYKDSTDGINYMDGHWGMDDNYCMDVHKELDVAELETFVASGILKVYTGSQH